MPAPSPLAPFLDPLERPGLPCCVTGSVASSVYGEPRLTADIDIVLLLKTADSGRLRAATLLDVAFVEREVTRLGLQQQWRQCAPEG